MQQVNDKNLDNTDTEDIFKPPVYTPLAPRSDSHSNLKLDMSKFNSKYSLEDIYGFDCDSVNIVDIDY